MYIPTETFLVPGLSLPTAPLGNDNAGKKRVTLDGRWRVSTVEEDGQVLDDFRGGTRVIAGNEYTLTPRIGDPISGTFTTGADGDPQAIDLVPTSGRFCGQTLHGLHVVVGNTLLICFAFPGKDRPTRFRSTPGSGLILAIQDREK
jgi:uncharacterized protein (TIGR03067 family)